MFFDNICIKEMAIELSAFKGDFEYSGKKYHLEFKNLLSKVEWNLHLAGYLLIFGFGMLINISEFLFIKLVDLLLIEAIIIVGFCFFKDKFKRIIRSNMLYNTKKVIIKN